MLRLLPLLIVVLSNMRAHAEPEDDDDPPTVEFSAAAGQGATLRLGDTFSLNVRSRIMLRYELAALEAANGARREEQLVTVGTMRLWLSGSILRPDLTYMIQFAFAQRDYRDGSTSPIYDAFLEWKAHRDISVRAGQYFVPFDRLRTVREWALQMTERPRPVSELTLDRDVGVMLFSDRFLGDRSPVAYRVGVFGGTGTNASIGKRPGGLLVARLELRPLGPLDDDREGDLARREKPALAIGAGIARNLNSNRVRSTTGGTFAGGTTDFTHVAADAVFKWRGFAMQLAYLWKTASVDEIRSIDADGAPLVEATRSGHGWVAQASYVLARPLEIVGRLSRLHARAGTDPLFIVDVERRGQEVGAGVNYYINQHWLKLQADWLARTSSDFALRNADHIVQVQIDATF